MSRPRTEPWFQTPYAIIHNGQLMSISAAARWFYLAAVITCMTTRNGGELSGKQLRGLMVDEPHRKRYIDEMTKSGLITPTSTPDRWRVNDVGGWARNWVETRHEPDVHPTGNRRAPAMNPTGTRRAPDVHPPGTRREPAMLDDGAAGQGAQQDYLTGTSMSSQKERERETTSRPASPDGRDVVARAAPLRADGAARPAPEKEKDQEQAVAGHSSEDCAGSDQFGSMSKADALASIRNSIANAKKNSPHVRDRDVKLSRWNGNSVPDLLGEVLGGEE